MDLWGEGGRLKTSNPETHMSLLIRRPLLRLMLSLRFLSTMMIKTTEKIPRMDPTTMPNFWETVRPEDDDDDDDGGDDLG